MLRPPISFNHTKTTPLCEIMEKRGSDKGTFTTKGRNWHNYTTFYYELFKGVKEKPLQIFELGLGTYNESVLSNMGKHGKPGASHYGWCDFFPNAQIFGADIDRTVLFESDRIKTFYCDQTSQAAIVALWNEPVLRDLEFDVLIDDGLHTFEANRCFFENSIQKLKKGGVYIIEDVLLKDLSKFRVQIEDWKGKYGLQAEIINIPHGRNIHDNCLIVFWA